MFRPAHALTVLNGYLQAFFGHFPSFNTTALTAMKLGYESAETVSRSTMTRMLHAPTLF